MTKLVLLIGFIASTMLLAPVPGSQEPADIVFVNGNIYTVNDKAPQAQAVAVKNERFIYVGSDWEAKRYVGGKTRVVDLHGLTVVPGLTDSHYHLIGVGERELTLNLEGITNLQDFLAKVKSQVDKTKPGAWVTGSGWIETFWKPPVFPTRWDLDKISPDNPVFLVRADGHGSVANSAALKIAGIDKNTANPFGGQVVKDLKTGEPTGMLLDNARALVTSHLPRQTEDDVEKDIVVGVERSLRMGLCQIQNAGSIYHPDVELLRKLYEEGKIKIRIYNAVYGPGPNAERLIKEGPTIDAYDHRFTMRTIKVVSDGALGSRGAALL
ncbi:MAG TPA: amidohydrolase family protein, partial [Blastocatellia bacterium]|nr:amidohydrolase family protein [Blastocatellia bacterium]